MRDNHRIDMRLHFVDRFVEEDGFAWLFAGLGFAVLYTDEITRLQMVAVFAVGCNDKIMTQ